MLFRKKVFLATFLSSAAVLVLLTFFSEEMVRRSLEKQYFDQYQTLGQVIGNTLRQMENATARISQVSVNGLYNRVKAEGILSEDALREYRTALGVSQLVIANERGEILRDTETPPKLRTATIFDFCDGYREILREPRRPETTPILPSFPSGESYIFTLAAAPGGRGIVEAGMHVRFVVETLRRALDADPNFQAIGLYTPHGLPLGEVVKEGSGIATNEKLPGLRAGINPAGPGHFAVVTEVTAPNPECCECKKKGLISADGRYFYYLRTEVSLAALVANQALAILGVALVLAALVALLVSARVVARLRSFHEGVKRINESGRLDETLPLEGRDEVGALAATFNQLTSRLQESQRRTLELEKSRALTEMATKVAHDIRSPLAVLKAAVRDLPASLSSEKKLFVAAVDRIQKIAEDLLDTYRGDRSRGKSASARSAPELVEEAVDFKLREWGGKFRGSIEFRPGAGDADLFLPLSESHFGRVLSNLLNNAAEATAFAGRITVILRAEGERVTVTVADDGPGIPPARLEELRRLGGTFGKEGGLGLGLRQAREYAEQVGGFLRIESDGGNGARVGLDLPRAAVPTWHTSELKIGAAVVIVDDDPSVHRAWEERILGAAPRTEVKHLFSLEELAATAADAGHALLLIDQDLGDPRETGLEAILRCRLEARSVLVTSHADDAELRDRCRQAGVRVLAKSRIATVALRTK